MLLAASSLVSGQELVPAENVKQATKQAAQKCKQGCLILSAEEVATIERNIALANAQAYAKGKNSCNGNI